MEERSEVEEVMVVVETPDYIPCQKKDSDMLHVKEVNFVEFIALVINCRAQTGNLRK